MLNLHSDDPVLVIGRWVAIGLIIAAPWGITRANSAVFRTSLWVAWYSGIFFLAALYLGFLTYHYNGPQLGFFIDGNSMNSWLIGLGLFSAIPFIFAARKGTIEKPFDVAVVVAFGVLLLVGPPILNSVALNIYTQGGGEFDSGQGDYSGEVSTPTDQQSWGFANGAGFVACNLVPLLIFMFIWKFSKRSDSNLVDVGQAQAEDDL